MTPQIDDGPRMPFGRYGREPSGEPGKLSPPAPMQSECIAGDAGIPRTDPQPERIKGHTRRFDRAIVRTRVQRACPPSSPSPFGRRQGSCSPRGICTDHVQNSIRDRRRLVAPNSFVTKVSPPLSCADSTENERKRRQMSAGGLCPYVGTTPSIRRFIHVYIQHLPCLDCPAGQAGAAQPARGLSNHTSLL